MRPRLPAVFFDFDGTYYRDHTIIHLMEHLAKDYPRIEDMMQEVRPVLVQYKERDVAFEQITNLLVERFWREERYVGIHYTDFRAAVEAIVASRRKRLHRFTRALVQSATELKMPQFVITGTHQEIAEGMLVDSPIVKIVGTKHCIGDDNRLLIGLAQDPATDKGIVVRRLAETDHLDLSRSVAIGDTINDVPMLREVGFPICFNPSDALFAEAERNDWPVVMEVRRIVVNQRTQVRHLGAGLPSDLAMLVRDKLMPRRV